MVERACHNVVVRFETSPLDAPFSRISTYCLLSSPAMQVSTIWSILEL
jgi:hypothetical protein